MSDRNPLGEQGTAEKTHSGNGKRRGENGRALDKETIVRRIRANLAEYGYIVSREAVLSAYEQVTEDQDTPQEHRRKQGIIGLFVAEMLWQNGLIQPRRGTRPCGPCRTRRLALHGMAPTRAERWLQGHNPDIHADGWARDQHIEMFGFAVLNRATVEFLRPYGPLLEVGAGLGYWAYELRQAGMDVAATDPHQTENWPENAVWTPAKRLTATRAIARYPGRNLLMCWPDRDKPWAAQALRAFRGARAVYVGEPPGGRTGTPDMFRAMEELYQVETEREIPNFTLVNDRLQVLRHTGPQA